MLSFAQTLKDAGHTVHAPDLFDGRTFTDVRDGVNYAQSLGEGTFAAKATEVIALLGTDLVYGGMSMGAARAAEQVLERPGAKGAFFLYGAIAPSWWEAKWPDGVPTQAHATEGDEWREPEAEEEYVADIPGAGRAASSIPGPATCSPSPATPDYDEEAARLATDRVLSFLVGL